MSFQQFSLSLIAAAIIAIPSQAIANPDKVPALYWEVNYGQLQTNKPKLDLDLVTATFGRKMNQYFAVEAFVGTGIGDETATVGSNQIETSLNYIYGINLKPTYALTRNLTAFGKLGYRWSEDEAKLIDGSDQGSFRSNGILLGVGGEYRVFNNLYINTSYNHVETEDGDNADLFSFGVGQQF